MTALPVSTDFTGAAVTEAGFKTAITSQRDFLSGLLGADGLVATALSTLKVPLSGVNAKTGAYTVVAADKGKVIYYTGSGGVNLTLPVTTTTDFGVGYAVIVKNMSSGTITIVRSGSDTIDGASSSALESGASVILWIAATAAWVRLGYTPALTDAQIASKSRIRQVVTAAIPTATDTTVIPADDTVPTSTEGTQVVSASITPAASANKIIVDVSLNVSVSALITELGPLTLFVAVAIFRGSTCIGATLCEVSTTNSNVATVTNHWPVHLHVIDSPAVTSSTTYSVRVGSNIVSSAWKVNDSSYFGGAMDNSILSLEELVV